MLLKVEKIQEIGRFASLKHKAPQFGRLNLIYARNGYGKSTLCSIIRSASEQDTLILAARRRLGAVKESLVQTEWQAAGNVTFASGRWSSCPGHIYVFDHEFIKRNVHVAESVTIENKRNLIPVVLGSYGVQLAEMISALDNEQRESSKKQAAAEKIIRVACPGVTDVKAFVEAEIPTDLDSKIISAERSLDLARQSIAVRTKKDPAKVVLRSASDIEKITQKSLDNVSETSMEQVNKHLDAHAMHPHGERWLKYGVEHTTDSSCPFCTQDISSIEIVSIFKGYFSSEYNALATDIEDVAKEIDLIYGEECEPFFDMVRQNDSDFVFWENVCDIGSPPSLTDEEQAAVKKSLKSLKELVAQKAKHPLSVCGLGEHREETIAGLELLFKYQEAVSKCTLIIQAARSDASRSGVSNAEEILQKYKALKARLVDPVKNESVVWTAIGKRRAEIEVEKGQAQEKLRTHMASTVSVRQKAINDLLEMFGASFKIVNTKASFIGREASTDFSIAIGPHSIKAGAHSEDEPSFSTVLSGGDKFTLALAFFITQVRADANLATARVVLDDPFSSQDTQRQWETSSQIRAIAADVCQVIVLSHDPRFLALIEKNASFCSTFQLACDDAGIGSISQWSSADELKEIYVRQAERIREYATKGKLLPGCTIESLIKDLRPFLEDFIRARFPSRFAPLIMLDKMVQEIEASGADDPFFKHVSEFRAINEYSRDNMHAGASVPDPEQLRAQCKRVIGIIGSY